MQKSFTDRFIKAAQNLRDAIQPVYARPSFRLIACVEKPTTVAVGEPRNAHYYMKGYLEDIFTKTGKNFDNKVFVISVTVDKISDSCDYIIRELEKDYSVLPPNTLVSVIYDRDDFSKDEFLRLESELNNKGFQSVFLNPGIEYWYLLHFIEHNDIGVSSRNKMRDRLLELLDISAAEYWDLRDRLFIKLSVTGSIEKAVLRFAKRRCLLHCKSCFFENECIGKGIDELVKQLADGVGIRLL